MYNNPSNPQLLLPKLKVETDVRGIDEAGKWELHKSKAFQDIASSLDYQAPGEVKSVSSVPTMWARPLSMEMALHNDKYPIREQMIEQWQGMLAAIALAEVRSFPLQAQLLELGGLKNKEFARCLLELLPADNNVLYTLNNKHPWQDIYIFLWDGQPVGMTSPSTLVCPSEEGNWNGLPWWLGGRLRAPHIFLNSIEKGLLWRWLENLQKNLNEQFSLSNNKYRGQKKAINEIVKLIGDFQYELGGKPEDTTLSLSDDPQFFGVELNRGVLIALNKPIKTPRKPSNVRLIASPDKKVKDLLIIDTEIAKAWNDQPQHIWVHDGKTLASLKIEDLKSKNIIWEDVNWIESKDLFLPKFYFINQEDALPGSLRPRETQPLVFEKEKITALIPLNPILLEYFTPEDLISKVQLQPLNSSSGLQIRVILDLPLSGLNAGKEGAQHQNYRLYKDYPIELDTGIPEVPILEVWPHFKTPEWKSYYAFYYDAEHGSDTFQIRFPEASQLSIFKDGRGAYQTVLLEKFPSFAVCENQQGNLLGLILFQTPEEVNPRSAWKIGVDFGTSFTNVYVNRNNKGEPLPLESLHLKVTETPVETRLPVLFEYFIPEKFIPDHKPMPLSSVLTTRGSSGANEEKQRPLFDGRIYVPDSFRFKPQEDWIKTGLKWSTENLVFNQLFLKHLSLHISAIAAKNGVRDIQWCLSYPSAFSRVDRNRYARTWQDITEELAAKTGIKHNCPTADNLEFFRTESLAVAQYFADEKGYNLVNTTCMDLGGGTSDISIWERNNLVHQCSVQLAGRDIFSQFLAMNPKFVERRLFDTSEIRGLHAGAFNAKLDVFLRFESENWLKYKKPFVQEEPDFKGLMQLTAIGTAGLYYYIGIMLKVLHSEGKYSQEEITPVYIGGNASRLLHWLSESGKFDRNSEINELLSEMLSKGSGFRNTEEKTILSDNPKEEVACGLVLNAKKLKELNKKQQDPLIAGEDYLLDGEEMGGESRLPSYPEEISDFGVPKLVQLPKFLCDFHVALKEFRIEGISPLEGYTRSPDPSDNEKLWRETSKEITQELTDAFKDKTENIRIEPPFILGLKALLKVLGRDWAEKW